MKYSGSGFLVTLVGQNDLPHGLFAADGSTRVTQDAGLGLYAPNGSLRIGSSGFSAYTPSGALNGSLSGNVFTPLPLQGGFSEALLRPISYVKAIANEGAGTSPLGPSNPQMGGTVHLVFYEDLSDGSFQIHFPHFAASAGVGEWSSGGTMTAEAVVVWIDNNDTQQVTTLTAQGGGSVASAQPFGRAKLYGSGIRGKVGSHGIINYRCVFPNGGYLSHARADYSNGESLSYGPSIAAPSATPYGNTWAGGGDFYGPCFIGGKCKRPTFGISGDSNHSGVLVSGVICDVPDTLDGGIGSVARHLVKNMAGIDVSVPGATASEMADPAKTAMRDSLLTQTDFIFPALGTNDMIFNTRTATQVATDIATAKSRQSGKTYFYPTVPAVIVSPSNNTPLQPARDPQRLSRNSSLRSDTATLFDIAVGTEQGTTGTLQDPTDVQDGTHFVAKGNKKAVAGTGFVVSTKIPGASLVNSGFKYPTGALYQSLELSDSWGTQQAVQTVRTRYSPEHRLTASLLREDAQNAEHTLFKQPTLSYGAAVTRKISFRAKRVSGTRNVMLDLYNSSFSGNARVIIDLGNGSVLQNSGFTGVWTTPTLDSITLDSDGYYVIGASIPAISANDNPFIFLKMTSGSANNYQGDNTSSIALWGLDIR